MDINRMSETQQQELFTELLDHISDEFAIATIVDWAREHNFAEELIHHLTPSED